MEHKKKTEELRVPDAKTGIRFSPALSPSAEAEPGKGEGSYANARHPTPLTATEAIKKPEARRRGEAARREGGLGNRKRSQKAKLACFVYPNPPISRRALRLSPGGEIRPAPPMDQLVNFIIRPPR
jgi:hypothetical protein